MGGSELPLFERLFGVATGVYCGAFAAAVYASTSSATVKTGCLLLITALPAILATEVCGGDAEAAKDLVESWTKEFTGTAVMTMATCSPGALIGHWGYKFEWLLHAGMMAFADSTCGGPQVNPVVTMSLIVCGGFGLTPKVAAANILAQCGGGILGWSLLIGGEGFLTGSVGGPSPDARLPWTYLALCEALGCWTLLAAVYSFATSKPFSQAGVKVYLAKMSLIALVVRILIVVHGATGPAVNPALATSFAYVSTGELPELTSTHYSTYWLGGIGGAALMGLVWRATNRGSHAAKYFPNEIFKIVVGIYLAAFGTVVWASYFRPQTDAFVAALNQAQWEQKLRDRNVVQKILRRAPKTA